MSTARIQKRRPVTYGKRINTATFDDWTTSPTKPSQRASQPQGTGSPRNSLVGFGLGATSRNLFHPSQRHEQTHEDRPPDIFDIPSSDDDNAFSHSRRKRDRKSSSPPSECDVKSASTASITSHDIDETDTSSGLLKRKRREDSADVQLQREIGMVKAMVVVPVRNGATLQAVEPRPNPPLATAASASRDLAPSKQKRLLANSTNSSGDYPKARKENMKQSKEGFALSRPVKSTSAPTRLRDMVLNLPTTTPQQTPVQSARSKQSRDGNSVKRLARPLTPPPETRKSADSAKKGSTTPRQRELLHRLLDSSPARNSPSSLPVSKLQISGATTNNLLRSISDLPQAEPTRRRRLINTFTKNVQSGTDDADFSNTADVVDEHSFTSNASTDMVVNNSQRQEPEMKVEPNQGQSKLTYGAVRTYLDDSTLDAQLALDVPLPSTQTTSSYGFNSFSHSSARDQGSSQVADGLDDTDEDQGPIKSIHELRARGNNERFVDDFYNLLQDIQYRGPKPLSRQRLGIMELCKLLPTEKYVDRMVDHGMDVQLFQACDGIEDPIFGFLVAVSIALMVETGISIQSVRNIQQSSVFSGLFETLGNKRGISSLSRDRVSNMSGIARTTLAEVCQLVKDNIPGIANITTALTPASMALTAMTLVLKKLRAAGTTDELLSEHQIEQLLACLEQALLDERPVSDDIRLIVGLFEVGAVSRSSVTSAWTARRRARLATAISKVLDCGNEQHNDTAPLCFQLLIDLTNNNPAACEQFGHPALMEKLYNLVITQFASLGERPPLSETADSDEDKDTVKMLDYLILALGAINIIAEHSGKARQAVLGGGPSPPLTELVRIFLGGRERAAMADTVQATQLNIPFAWLAVALGTLCQDGRVAAAVARMLPGGHLSVLAQAVGEFALYNKRLEEDMFEMGGGNEMGDEKEQGEGVTEMLLRVAERLKRV